MGGLMGRVLLFFSLFFALGLAHADEYTDHIPQFRKVSDGIYRGGRSDDKGFLLLWQLGIKTVVNLENDDDAIANETSALEKLGIREISLPMSGFWKPDDRTVNQALTLIANPLNYPIFVHCQHGQDRTGVVLGLFRVFEQKWTPKAAYDEMLDIGFHPALIFLDNYYREKTGMTWDLQVNK
jgi:tyrosine-protein phosphatase SIW14